MKKIPYLLAAVVLAACQGEINKEDQTLMAAIDHKVKSIDHNHRLQIIEDDFVKADSTYKVRGYYNEGSLTKLIGIIKTPHFVRDDYFYFERNKPIYSGHMINFVDDKLAEEFKYYYNHSGDSIVESLFWKDTYQPGQRFPHETFRVFKPSFDSLMGEEQTRIAFYLSHLATEGFEVKHGKENLEANSTR